MDTTVRIWDTRTGACLHVLTGHTSLVGLLALPPSGAFLLSGSADSTLRVWDPASGALRQVLAGHTGAITCCAADEHKVVSGSDGTLLVWDVRTGECARKLLTGVIGAWQLALEGRWCVAASSRQGDSKTMLNIYDFSQEEEQ